MPLPQIAMATFACVISNEMDGEAIGGAVKKMKDQDNKVDVYEWEGDDDLFLDQLDGDFEDTDFMGGEYKIGLSPDPDTVIDFFKDNKKGRLSKFKKCY